MKNSYILKHVKPTRSALASFILSAEFCKCKDAKKSKWNFAGVPDQFLLIAYRHRKGEVTEAFLIGTDDDSWDDQSDFGVKSMRFFSIEGACVRGLAQHDYVPQTQLMIQLAILDLSEIHSAHFKNAFPDDWAGTSFLWLKQVLDAGKIANAF